MNVILLSINSSQNPSDPNNFQAGEIYETKTDCILLNISDD